MPPITTTLTTLATILTLAQTAMVIDMAGRFSNYTCFKNSGVSQVIIRAYHSYGAIDLDAKQNVLLANAAGLATDVYMFPCRGKDPAGQVKELLDYLDSMRSVEAAFAYTTGCSWTIGNFQTNCQFIKTLVDLLESKGRSVGIYASHYMWPLILGGLDKCPLFTTLPIWYAHYDNVQSFADWDANKFGGWATPTMKQYAGDAVVCGYKVDLSYY